MQDTVDPIAERLHSLESALPGGKLPLGVFDTPPGMRRRSRRLGLVAGIVAAMVISGVAGAAVAHQVMTTGITQTHGAFSPGGVLACSPIQHMSPAEASKALTTLGYLVTWQIQYRAVDPNQDSGTTSSTPPPDGYIIEGVVDGHQITLLVDRGPAAHAARGC